MKEAGLKTDSANRLSVHSPQDVRVPERGQRVEAKHKRDHDDDVR